MAITRAKLITPEEEEVSPSTEDKRFLPMDDDLGNMGMEELPVETLPQEEPVSTVLDIPVTLPSSHKSLRQEIEMNDTVASTMSVLESEEKVDRNYPYFPGENMRAEAVVNINEVRYTFPKGRPVKIPKSIAAVYDARYQVEVLNGDVLPSMRIDRANLMLDGK